MNYFTNLGQIIKTWLILTATAAVSVDTCGRAVIYSWFNILSRRRASLMLKAWSRRNLRLAKVKVKVINPHHIQLENYSCVILMCNHASLYDIPVTLQAFPGADIRMLTKKELFKIPIFGGGMAVSEFVSIDRNNHQQALKDLDKAKQLLKSGIILWVAPEGTRAHNDRLGKLKKGGFVTAISVKATIIPLGIIGTEKIMPAKTFKLQRGCEVEVHVGQPIDASQYTLANKQSLMDKVAAQLSQLSGRKLPLSSNNTQNKEPV